MTTLESATRLWTDAGWVWAGDLAAGRKVLCLHGDGHLRMTRVHSVTPPFKQDVVAVLTEVGDVVVPVHEPLLTTGGPVLASELSALGTQGTIKVEVVQPKGIAAFCPSKVSTGRQAANVALSWLGRHWTAAPTSLSLERRAALATILAKSGLPVTTSADERWLSWTWRPAADVDRTLRPSGEAMLALTAWGDDYSRTILTDRKIRSAILMAITLEGRQAKVAWTPGYAPVECRISVQSAAMPYAKLVAARTLRSQVVTLNLDRVGAVVTSQLAVGRLG